MADGATPDYPAWAQPIENVLKHHAVDAASGLSEEQIEERRAVYGFNELEKPPQTPL
jgi:hypothetical protein